MTTTSRQADKQRLLDLTCLPNCQIANRNCNRASKAYRRTTIGIKFQRPEGYCHRNCMSAKLTRGGGGRWEEGGGVDEGGRRRGGERVIQNQVKTIE